MQNHDRLIIFLIPPVELVNGGILSIFSLCKVSREYKKIHGAEVVLATYPGTKSYGRNTLFENDEKIYSFDELVKRGAPEFLLIHVPEYASGEIFSGLNRYSEYLKSIPDLHINIMNQNILMMPKPLDAAEWFSLTNNVTQTTAHNKYTTQKLANIYNLPTHHFSTFVDASQYHWVPFEKKKKIIAISLDVTEKKDLIVSSLKKQLPDYEVITIQNMTYEKYKEFIASAKYTVTFGEGFDGYFIEAFFSGGIAFSVYNEDFFPDKEFSKFQNIYSSYAQMLKDIAKDMRELDKKTVYENIVNKTLDRVNKLYKYSVYLENVKNFYLNKYTFTPAKYSAEDLIGRLAIDRQKIISERDKMISEKDAVISERDKMISEKDAVISERDRVIEEVYDSFSWKLTKPIRGTSAVVKKRKK